MEKSPSALFQESRGNSWDGPPSLPCFDATQMVRASDRCGETWALQFAETEAYMQI